MENCTGLCRGMGKITGVGEWLQRAGAAIQKRTLIGGSTNFVFVSASSSSSTAAPRRCHCSALASISLRPAVPTAQCSVPWRSSSHFNTVAVDQVHHRPGPVAEQVE